MLTIEGALDLALDAVPLRCEARGQELRVHCDDLPGLLRTARSLGGGASGGPLPRVQRVARLLEHYGLTVRLYSRGRLVLIIGAQARPGLTERFLGLAHLQLGSGVGELLQLFRP
ncbi:MAG TPA: hypothetical protein VKZ60_12105 [Chloroflexota bacterium]|nr:hypothetical protein [Chloroflexota bacterium]